MNYFGQVVLEVLVNNYLKSYIESSEMQVFSPLLDFLKGEN